MCSLFVIDKVLEKSYDDNMSKDYTQLGSVKYYAQIGLRTLCE